jgi:hypothetical protein
VARIASYNVENLFARPKVFRTADWTLGEPKLAAYEQVNSLFKKDAYPQQDKAEMKSLLVELDIYFVNEHGAVRRKETSSPRWAWLRKNRGGFDRQPEDKTKDVEIIASGRDDWIGWVELAKEAVDETSTRMTAKVIAEGVNAEIIAVIEAEDRPSLLRFNEELLGEKYRHIMLVDGNDPRGIDVGLMTKSGFPIRTIRSNVDAEDALGRHRDPLRRDHHRQPVDQSNDRLEAGAPAPYHHRGAERRRGDGALLECRGRLGTAAQVRREVRPIVPEAAEVDDLGDAGALRLGRDGRGGPLVTLAEVGCAQRVNEVVNDVDAVEGPAHRRVVRDVARHALHPVVFEPDAASRNRDDVVLPRELGQERTSDETRGAEDRDLHDASAISRLK